MVTAVHRCSRILFVDFFIFVAFFVGAELLTQTPRLKWCGQIHVTHEFGHKNQEDWTATPSANNLGRHIRLKNRGTREQIEKSEEEDEPRGTEDPSGHQKKV
jgi:hypothetical protein